MEFLSSDKIGIMDLATGEVTEDELAEDLVQEKIGGAAINAHLYQEHQDGDPIVLGCGLLTGSLVPGTDLGIITAKSPVTGELCHVPIVQYAGMELKYSGFDYLVLKNRAAAPSLVWIHDGIADLEAAGDLWGRDVWQTVTAVRSRMGDDLIQVLAAGPAAERGSSLAALSNNFWAGADRFGLAKALAERNVKAIAIRGMGLLEVAEDEDFVSRCLELLAEVKGGAWAGKQGLGDLAAALGDSDAAGWQEPLTHRSRASFNVPYPYNTFAMISGDPSAMVEPSEEEPGVLLSDPMAALALKNLGLGVTDAAQIIMDCAKAGLDAAGVASVCAASGKSDAAAIGAALADIDGSVDGLSGPFSPWAPAQPLFADFGDSGEAWWKRRQAVAYTFGLDPIFALMCPELSEDVLVEMAAMGTELEITADTLNQVVAGLIG